MIAANPYPDGIALLAPVAGHTDLPFRLSARRHGCRYAFTEMIDAGSLVYNVKKTRDQRLARDPSETFLGVQLVGSDIPQLERAAGILNDLDFDVVDFNLGCPAPKVAKKGEGITFALKRPDDAIRSFEALVQKSRFPVTVKTRIQSETDLESTVRFCHRLYDAGAAALTLHGRVMKVFYSGPVFYDVIRAVREDLPIPVIANGGALTPEGYARLLAETGCSRGMIARGALGNPWIFREIANPAGLPPTLDELIAEIDLHVHRMIDFYGVELGFRLARKIVLDYVHGRGFPGALRASISYLSGWNTFAAFLRGLREGPSPRYWECLKQHPEDVERKLLPTSPCC